MRDNVQAGDALFFVFPLLCTQVLPSICVPDHTVPPWTILEVDPKFELSVESPSHDASGSKGVAQVPDCFIVFVLAGVVLPELAFGEVELKWLHAACLDDDVVREIVVVDNTTLVDSLSGVDHTLDQPMVIGIWRRLLDVQ